MFVKKIVIHVINFNIVEIYEWRLEGFKCIVYKTTFFTVLRLFLNQ